VPKARIVSIVIAEDSLPDVILFQEALHSVGIEAQLKVFSDGEECASYFGMSETPLPDLIILDLNLPKVDGFDLIRVVRSHRRYDQVPVAVLTSSTAAKDKNLSLDLGANTFISKPSRLDEFVETIGSAIRVQLGDTGGTETSDLTWEPGPKPRAGRRRRYYHLIMIPRRNYKFERRSFHFSMEPQNRPFDYKGYWRFRLK